MSSNHHLPRRASLARFALLPIGFYTIVFVLLTFPLITKFNTHYFGDAGDAVTNYWNIWWVNKAVTEIHQLPWHTHYVHYPHGSTLLGHTVNPINSGMGIFLLRFLTITKTYNVIVLLAFVGSGFTAFLLAYHLTRSYWGSIIGGSIFTFSNFHFAHAEGHMQMMSTQWLPLFVLCWHILLIKPSIRIAVASALVLFAVLLGAYYFFLYCVLTGFLMVLWYAWRKRDLLFPIRGPHLVPFLTFCGLAVLLSSPLIVALVLSNVRDPMIGAHPPEQFTLGLFTLFIPGGHWKFAHWTQAYWSRLPGNYHESSVHLGIAVTFVLTYVWWNRKKIPVPNLGLWYLIFAFFVVLSFGPLFHVWGKPISFIPMPYTFLERIIPPMKMSGVPIRMIVMSILSASVISAVGFQRLLDTKPRWALALLMLMCFEFLPRPIPSTRFPTSAAVNVLKRLPGEEGVIDLANGDLFSLYYQTIHEKPIAFGYIGRLPSSVAKKDRRISRLIGRRRFGTLCRELKFRYLLVDAKAPKPEDGLSPQALFKDSSVTLYDLGPNGECRR